MKYKDCVQYLGPSNCNNIKGMALGSISETIFYNNGFYIFKIDELSQTQVNETNFNDFKEKKGDVVQTILSQIDVIVLNNEINNINLFVRRSFSEHLVSWINDAASRL